MIIEYAEEINKLIIYCQPKTNKSLWHRLIVPSTRLIEQIDTVTIISGTPYLLPSKVERPDQNLKIKCQHSQEFLATKIQKMPNETLSELIECWTCHIPISKSHISTPTKETILLSDFYILIHQQSLPNCCSSDSIIVKYFLNELITNLDFQKRVFDYLIDCFVIKDFLVVKYKNKNYEIKFFYKSNICNQKMEMIECLKVGIRETEMIVRNKEVINEYFMGVIYELVRKCEVGVAVYGYEVCLLRGFEI